jgi:hypothetical protein
MTPVTISGLSKRNYAILLMTKQCRCLFIVLIENLSILEVNVDIGDPNMPFCAERFIPPLAKSLEHPIGSWSIECSAQIMVTQATDFSTFLTSQYG